MIDRCLIKNVYTFFENFDLKIWLKNDMVRVRKQAR